MQIFAQIKKAKPIVASYGRASFHGTREEEMRSEEPGPVRLITQFGAQWDAVCEIPQKHWGILTNTSGLESIVGTVPKMAAHRARNLGDMLIHTEFPKESKMTWK